VRQGEGVQVRNRFDGNWVYGFEVADVEDGDDERLFRLRRRSDGVVLPALFRETDVREGELGAPQPLP
jgi:hypothetical protein